MAARAVRAPLTRRAECLTDDAITVTHGFAQVSGTRNRETMLATVDAFNEIVPAGFRPKFHKVVAEDDTVFVEWVGNAVLSNGAPYCNQYVFIFSFRDRNIRLIDEYFCTVLADTTILPLLAAKGAEMARIPPRFITGTIMSEQSFASGKQPMSREALAQAGPICREGQPEDIAGAVSWLASDDAGFVTGQVIPVNGGRIIG